MKQHRTRSWLIGLILIVFSLGLAPVTYAQESAPPMITADPLVIEVGASSYDPLEGVILSDDVDTQEMLWASLEHYDKIDTSYEGVSFIYYLLHDSDGNVAELERPVIVLGPDQPLIFARSAYIQMDGTFDAMEGVIAWDLIDGDLTADVVVEPYSIDTSVPGEYGINLSVTDGDGFTTEAIKYVIVEYPYEYYPVITAPDVMISMGAPFHVMDGVTAYDLTDLDITAQIQLDWTNLDVEQPGIYYAYYDVVNSLGLSGHAERRIVVLDPAASPQIFADDIYLETGWEFDPKGYASAWDLEEGDISNRIEVVVNTVDITKPGEYSVTYQVTDGDGNTAVKTVMVWVEWSYDLYPRIYLEQNPIYLPVGGEFVPGTGVRAEDYNGVDLTGKLVIEDLYLDLSTPGQYYVVYSVTSPLEITVYEYQEIYVLGSSEPVIRAWDFSSRLNDELEIWMADYVAYDLEDGDLRDFVTWDISAVDVTTAGIYPVTFMVTDSDGHTASVTVEVTIIDYSYPQLWVEDYQVIVDSEFDPLDYVNAYDEQDGELTSQVMVVKNGVRIHKLGTYYVTYAVTDSDGHTTTQTVSVEVVPEPMYTYFINYQDQQIPLNIDYAQEMLFLTSDITIPAGSEVSLAVYNHGEPEFEITMRLVDEIQPGITYRVDLSEEGLTATAMTPHLWNGVGFRTTARTAEVRFMATVGGTIHYVVGNAGTELPEIDTNLDGIAGSAGLNVIKLSGLKPRTAQTVWVLIEVPEEGVSNILEIEVPAIPTGPADKGKPENPGKPVDPGKP